MFSWFATNTGRLFTRTVIGVASVSVFGAHLVPQGPLLEKYKNVLSLYELDEPSTLDEKTITLAQKVMEDMKLDEKERSRICFFSVLGHEVFHAGGTDSPWGAIIGLPFNFQIEKKFNMNQLRLVGVKDFSWDIDGLDLKDAMNLSEAAKKFAIAREILAASAKDILENALIATILLVMVPARLSHICNKKFNTFRFPLRTRLFIYVMNYCAGYLLYYCLKQPFGHFHSKEYDEVAAKISTEYLQGGIEFYEKTLSKNKELRELMGAKGERLYTQEGNENYILFAPRLPTTKRLQFLLDLEKEMNKVSE